MQNNIPSDVLLRVDNLCQYFKLGSKELRAVDHVSFDIKKGEVFGLVGESGCGKTTTGRSIIKIHQITGGNVFYKGQRIAAGTRGYTDRIAAIKKEYAERVASDRSNKSAILKERDGKIAEVRAEMKAAVAEARNCDRNYAAKLVAEVDAEYRPLIEKATASGDSAELARVKKEYKAKRRVAQKTRLVTQIQMIFQDPVSSLNPRMTVREIISEGLVINGIRDKEYIDEKVYEILELVGLVREHAGRYPHEFSGGQKQRIGIARSVIMRPEMIIADEPVSALDVSIQAQVINLLNELKEQLGLTILFIAHDLSVVKYFSDRIGVMYFGKLVELADSDELFRHPLHPYTRSLLSAIPLPDPKSEKNRKRIIYKPLEEHD